METEQVMQAARHTTSARSACPETLSPEGDEDDGAASARPCAVAVLPEQFFSPAACPQKMRGEVALMSAVLEDAIACFQHGALTTKRRAQRLAREAEEWLFTDDLRWTFSFVNVCAVLGLEPAYLRLGLKRWRQHPLVKQ